MNNEIERKGLRDLIDDSVDLTIGVSRTVYPVVKVFKYPNNSTENIQKNIMDTMASLVVEESALERCKIGSNYQGKKTDIMLTETYIEWHKETIDELVAVLNNFKKLHGAINNNGI